jgi:hypothetical protein
MTTSGPAGQPPQPGPAWPPNTTFFEVVSEAVLEVVFLGGEVVLARA